VAGALISPESLLGAGVFAAASASLGWILRARHMPVALVGAMIWAAGTDAALALVGDGSLGDRPSGVVIAALAAVAIEFGLLRADTRPAAPPPPRRGVTGLPAATP